jgi:hypothetical protein
VPSITEETITRYPFPGVRFPWARWQLEGTSKADNREPNKKASARAKAFWWPGFAMLLAAYTWFTSFWWSSLRLSSLPAWVLPPSAFFSLERPFYGYVSAMLPNPWEQH